jgi:galactokinase
VRDAAAAIERGDATALGALMYASHASLRVDYAVSCAELDLLVEIAQRSEGVYGARMTGGGFGGCTVNLVRSDCVADFEMQVVREYQSATGTTPQIFVCRASDGVGESADV